MQRAQLIGVAVVVAFVTSFHPTPLQAQWAYADRPYFTFEGGVRYWYSVGEFQKTLYDNTGSLRVSRLTYEAEPGHSGEAYFNLTYYNNWFLKGYAGGGILTGKNLKDEDFPPVTDPYSSTDSDVDKSRLGYASIDLGYNLINLSQAKLGVFVGYHYKREHLNAYGCTQTATNPLICDPAIPDSVKVITQKNHWHSLRVGLAGEIALMPNLRLSGDAAYLPVVRMNGEDIHWLRLGVDFDGPTPEDGRGSGVQFETMLTYTYNSYATIGVGGRYWRMEAPRGKAHFEDSVIGGALPQVEKFKTERMGAFVQLGFKY